MESSTTDDPNPNPNPSHNRKHQALLARLSKRHPTPPSSSTTTTTTTSTATATTFLAQFSDLKSQITTQISLLQSSSTTTTTTSLDSISASISDLDSFLSHNSHLLSPYDLRSSLNSISDLRNSLNSLYPKPKKFQFKNKSKSNSSHHLPEPDQIKTESDNDVGLSSELGGLIGPGVRDREGEVVEEDFRGKEVGEFTLSDLRACEVRIKGRVRALFVHRLRECKVYCGPVLSSILIEDVKDCVFVLASHQIRIHEAETCEFYLRVRSRPIIEGSGMVRFGPYCLDYDGVEEDLKEARLEVENGNWGNVDDFGWLRAVQSPNWSVILEDERIPAVSI